MATQIEEGKSVTREVEVNGNTICVSISNEGITFRPKGKRAEVAMTHEQLMTYMLGFAEKKIQKVFQHLGKE